ncbi:hypothetical protein BCR33DRAFT_724267 [Rhizoclosmatium globosum]|uniref:Uncharacterized protein n=1 Tax=Rhizoclosmatium globosum TaxID=329046 RepID=A0A1Y2B9I2_9FUNG|nr:hypothetical protein BCR33DRAFT_724267 [Rhizoclosmatium globosum]|eukprot:ORY30745.1 hypothetical protein BCR33DRAFT_724267 [Rhizoclosmatium globosum]
MVPSFGGNVAHAITSSIGLVINSAIVLALLYTPGVLVSRLHFALLYLMCVFIVGSLPIAAMNIRLAVYPTPIPDIGMRIIIPTQSGLCDLCKLVIQEKNILLN